MIKVRYIYSACIVIETPDTRILCDPWFTDGIFNGSWYQYPKLDNPIEKISECEFVYISHLHMDHYDRTFLRTYLERFPKARILIADFKINYLANLMTLDGFSYEVVQSLTKGDTVVTIFPNEDPEHINVNDIDSALVCQHKEHSVINMNDNRYNPSQVAAIKTICPEPDIAFLSYASAGPFPQTCYPLEEEALLYENADRKKKVFFDRYLEMRAALSPKITLPFAGQYILGGKLYLLNKYRGAADATEILKIDPNSCVLDDGGDAFIDTDNLMPSRARTEKFDGKDLEKYLESIKDNLMDYEKWFTDTPINILPIKRLLAKAYKNALDKSLVEDDFYFCIQLPENDWAVFNANKENPEFSIQQTCEDFTPRQEVLIDPRLLFGLIVCVFHWGNVGVGSQYDTRWEPDVYKLHVMDFFNFFHV